MALRTLDTASPNDTLRLPLRVDDADVPNVVDIAEASKVPDNPIPKTNKPHGTTCRVKVREKHTSNDKMIHDACPTNASDISDTATMATGANIALIIMHARPTVELVCEGVAGCRQWSTCAHAAG